VAAFAKIVSNWLQAWAQRRITMSKKDPEGNVLEITVGGPPSKHDRQMIEDFLTGKHPE